MQYSFAAVLALAATATAYSNNTVSYTTDIVTQYVTYCPASAAITVGGQTYSNTASTAASITLTNGPYTIVTPVTKTSSVYCNTCAAATPTTVAPVYSNGTVPAVTPVVVATPASTPVGTGSVPVATVSPSGIAASGANKAFAMSGASLVGLLGLAAYIL